MSFNTTLRKTKLFKKKLLSLTCGTQKLNKYSQSHKRINVFDKVSYISSNMLVNNSVLIDKLNNVILQGFFS